MVLSLGLFTVVPLTAVGVVAPWIGGLAAVLMASRGERRAGRRAGTGALILLAWVPLLVASGAVAIRLQQPLISLAGTAAALVVCVAGNTLLAGSAGIHEASAVDPEPILKYLRGTVLSLVAIAGLTGLVHALEGLHGDLFALVFLGAGAAAVFGPLWICGAGAVLAFTRAVRLPRIEDADWAEHE